MCVWHTFFEYTPKKKIESKYYYVGNMHMNKPLILLRFAIIIMLFSFAFLMNECKIFRALGKVLFSAHYILMCTCVPRIQSPSSCLHNSFFFIMFIVALIHSICINIAENKRKILHNLTVYVHLLVCCDEYRQLFWDQEVQLLLYNCFEEFFYNIYFSVA